MQFYRPKLVREPRQPPGLQLVLLTVHWIVLFSENDYKYDKFTAKTVYTLGYESSNDEMLDSIPHTTQPVNQKWSILQASHMRFHLVFAKGKSDKSGLQRLSIICNRESNWYAAINKLVWANTTWTPAFYSIFYSLLMWDVLIDSKGGRKKNVAHNFYSFSFLPPIKLGQMMGVLLCGSPLLIFQMKMATFLLHMSLNKDDARHFT